ncbi:BZ3500_MvSof-1268-A1-R1_Chr8-2g10067 [Microbotryum saponariae]|uniref:BZ3500_MvSof-1268-A1-R1_Chr8-2g10067 protein n=1 Tax=Microbotryum saponariae TaxID=289078 RepID=A0A2X0KWM0_9BASI|nr:BZ3500_MvSof-1268-A1-R1_Chr8-2g10067 [Microbotryum saponariae]SDA01717.1 BZ3501_MvSof-1269-A2-R1_Chr8-2g09817 [Microbotryum saponariae]
MPFSSGPDNANPVVHATPSSRRCRSSARVRHLELEDDNDWLTPNGASGATSPPSILDTIVARVEHMPGPTEAIDSDEIFDLIRSITDPEHPLTLEQLAVVSAPQIHVTDGARPSVHVEFTPTIPHCSMATLIGLSLRVRLLRSLPERFKVDIKVKEGSHQSENAVNKQLNDKERVAAALENSHLVSVVQQCLSTADYRGRVL